MKKDLNYVAGMEKAISKRYGEEAIQNPKSTWDQEKEKEYIQQLEKRIEKLRETEEESEKIEINGFLMPKKLLNREVVNNCTTCGKKLKTVRDDIYMNKYDCCESCFIEHIEGREQRWLDGWRPNQGENE